MSAHSLSNADVRWHGTRAGLTPQLSDRASEIVDLGESAIPALMEALEDPNAFVAAHVLLTMIAGIGYATFPSWNGLVVDLDADGVPRIDPAQRRAIADRWRQWRDARLRHQIGRS